MIKIIGIGNVFMEDDGIGVAAAKAIAKRIDNENVKNIQVIIGETDMDYSISFIDEGDLVFVIDGACYGKKVGQLSVLSMNEYDNKKYSSTLHSYNLVDLIKSYFRSIRVYIIGIEISNIDFRIGFSDELNKKLNDVYSDVWNEIVSIVCNNMEV